MSVKLWSIPSGECIRVYADGHDGWITSVAISPSGCIFASASYDTTILLWDIESGIYTSVLICLVSLNLSAQEYYPGVKGLDSDQEKIGKLLGTSKTSTK